MLDFLFKAQNKLRKTEDRIIIIRLLFLFSLKLPIVVIVARKKKYSGFSLWKNNCTTRKIKASDWRFPLHRRRVSRDVTSGLKKKQKHRNETFRLPCTLTTLKN